MPKQSAPSEPPGRSKIHIDTVAGHLLVVATPQAPDIPEGKARHCPQCGAEAWAETRFCWRCAFDFDRAAMPWCHPVKLLFLSAAVNLAAAALMLASAVTEFLR